MPDAVEDFIADLEETTTYPGTDRPVRRSPRPETQEDEPETQDWESMGQIFLLRGQQMEFFLIGALAAATGKSPATIRRWEREGWLPAPRYRAPAVRGTISGVQGRPRLYTRAQVVAVRRAVKEAGMDKAAPRKVDIGGFINSLHRAMEQQ